MHTDIHALSGIQPMIPVFERAKTVHALDREATVIGVVSPSQDVFHQRVALKKKQKSAFLTELVQK
jgi:hypothetical protein